MCIDAEMPKYKCHKEVHALKIENIISDIDKAIKEDRETNGGATIIPEDKGYAPFKVDADYINKYNPQANGYYVVDENGYKSFSPANVFEEGYTKIE